MGIVGHTKDHIEDYIGVMMSTGLLGTIVGINGGITRYNVINGYMMICYGYMI